MTADEHETNRPTPSGWPDVASPQQLAAMLRRVDYLADEGLAAAAFLALRMRRPLFLEGEPGVGKTSFAQKIAEALGARPIRLQCHGGIDASQALYDWNFPRQILALRAAEDGARDGIVTQLYSWDFLVRRPILDALENGPAVLLIDEIDRADDEFEALLLEVLEANSVSIPELGEVRAAIPPLVILTSNRTREVHDALKRRCLYHWIPHPDPDREVEILRQRVAALPDDLARQIADGMRRLRAARDLAKTPGVAESIDLAHALIETGATALTPTALSVTLSAVVKHHDDQAPVQDLLPMRQDRVMDSE